MKMLRNLSLALVAAIALAACAGGSGTHLPSLLNDAKMMSPSGSAFNQSLHKYYTALSTFEKGQNDLPSTGLFAHRAIVAGGGASILPEEIAMRDLPAANVGELTNARQRLLAALDGGGRDNHPDLAALAQVKFDCWMEQQEENVQPDHIAACKLEFDDAMKRLTAMPVAAPAPAPAAPKPMPKVAKTFIIYFDFDSADINDAANQVVSEIVAAKGWMKPSAITLSGHTDSSGSNDYNKKLSNRRAEAVVKALADRGVSASIIEAGHYGEDRLRVPTGDGVKEAGNRRVEVYFESSAQTAPARPDGYNPLTAPKHDKAM